MDSVSDWFSVNLDELFEQAKNNGGEVEKRTPTRVDMVFDDHSRLRITVTGIYALNPNGEVTHKTIFEADDGEP